MDLAAIETACTDTIQSAWDTCLKELAPTSSAFELEDALTLVTYRRDEFLTACREITDPRDLNHVVAMMYIESKSAWIMYNTTVGYQYLSRGAAEPMTVLLASLTSQFIAALEPLLTPKALDEITEFLAQPAV